ncbi:MAG: hypothetical protein VR74_05985 [Hyphomonas sp. BRH_c22]|uniref:TRAFAC clade GTPase domain-containing protein n=1 Tax=Hyphomonas sp. BRH_c22 TaxID=1629710 RepID=UPI0005F25B32|nr:hypothetical protein [Hyphomonas sp. BRH_c22]KJS38337.1 MAG: hypothetical protein VR74_05985 [Hyphomonas sp. BRH_c22]
MSNGSVVVCGLPAAGKTTYLAALWEVLQDGGPSTQLQMASRDHDDYRYVRKIHKRWIEGVRQERTEGPDREAVGLDMTDGTGGAFTLRFPDLGGEVFTQLWEERTCDTEIADMLSTRRGVMLFVHADKITQPRHLIDELNDSAEMGDATSIGEALPFAPRLAPCQVKIVDLLQMMTSRHINAPPGNLAIILSAWDRVSVGDLTPEQHLATQMPLLDQYLKAGGDGWRPAIFGVSAQGTDYVKREHPGDLPQSLVDICKLRKPHERIRVVSNCVEDHDLTRPIAWVVS